MPMTGPNPTPKRDIKGQKDNIDQFNLRDDDITYN